MVSPDSPRILRASRECYGRIIVEAIASDTHGFVKRLTESGFTEKRAETFTDETRRPPHRQPHHQGRYRSPAGRNNCSHEVVKAEFVKWLFGALIA